MVFQEMLSRKNRLTCVIRRIFGWRRFYAFWNLEMFVLVVPYTTI